MSEATDNYYIKQDELRAQQSQQQQSQQQQQQLPNQDLVNYFTDLSTRQDLDQQRRITTLAQYGKIKGFTIHFKKPTGNNTFDPFEEKQEAEYTYQHDDPEFMKTYHRRPIGFSDWEKYQSKNAELLTIKDDIQRKKLLIKIIEFLAIRYLGMTHEEFEKSNQDEVSMAVMACNYITDLGGDIDTSKVREKLTSGNNNDPLFMMEFKPIPADVVQDNSSRTD